MRATRRPAPQARVLRAAEDDRRSPLPAGAPSPAPAPALTWPSALAVANLFPSGENRTQLTKRLWSCGKADSHPVVTGGSGKSCVKCPLAAEAAAPVWTAGAQGDPGAQQVPGGSRLSWGGRSARKALRPQLSRPPLLWSPQAWPRPHTAGARGELLRSYGHSSTAMTFTSNKNPSGK